MTALGEKYSLLVPICRSDRTKEHTTFLLFKIFIYLTGEGEKSQEETEEAMSRVLTQSFMALWKLPALGVLFFLLLGLQRGPLS